MRCENRRCSGWQGAALVTLTYVYFLIFAQFAFLKRLTNIGIADSRLKIVMAAMAAAGIFSSLLAPRSITWPSPKLRLRIALAIATAAAFATSAPLDFSGAVVIAFFIGAALGLLTVTLVTHLRDLANGGDLIFVAGVGTGVGYLICNFPPLFNAPATTQASVAGLFCLVGIGVTFFADASPPEPPCPNKEAATPLWRALPAFTALVWLDSAAFFIIQNTQQLKAGTWLGSAHLWSNGALHLAAALISTLLLRRWGLAPVLISAFLALGGACLLLLNPSHAFPASLLYPVGVSLYSVALVVYPSKLAAATSSAERGRVAGWLYSVAGWFGSAMGIGMAQHLHAVPATFVAAAGCVILVPQILWLVQRRGRELALTGVVISVAVFVNTMLSAHSAPRQLSQIARGRRVYISEGCIHCHSQYVRPNTADVDLWGPASTVDQVRREDPPLIGNRRQGPDLSEVGARRSAIWLKAHFFNPAEVSGASIMPSFGFLFKDSRGDDLVAYLQSLGADRIPERLAMETTWCLDPGAIAQANADEGRRLFYHDCATCHTPQGPTRMRWKSSFRRVPINLTRGPYSFLVPQQSRSQIMNQIARNVKFGIAGTDMPGHEVLSDQQIASISLWLSEAVAQSAVKPHLQPPSGKEN